jgi:hypothetical protein
MSGITQNAADRQLHFAKTILCEVSKLALLSHQLSVLLPLALLGRKKQETLNICSATCGVFGILPSRQNETRVALQRIV